MSKTPISSPSYPSQSLLDAVNNVAKIEKEYRTSAADRKEAAKLIGYSGLSGPANQALAALASYGLVERAGKGMIRVTSLAISILHPTSETEKNEALKKAAITPPLFKEIREQFPELAVPPEAGVITHLNRTGFNPNAVPKAAKAFLSTAKFVEQLIASESHDIGNENEGKCEPLDDKFGGATVGDYIQWENQGVLQFQIPQKVRWVSDDGTHLAVEGSDTGIPMNQVILESAPDMQIPPLQSPPPSRQDDQSIAAREGQRKAVFPVSEGDVTFIFPKDMTLDGIEELEAYLAVFLKKEKRNAGVS